MICMDHVRIAEAIAPASTANLGCLFDLAAMAVDAWTDKVIVKVEKGREVKVEGEGIPSGKENTAYHAAVAVLEKYGDPPVGLNIKVVKGVPVGIGLGSSGATAAAAAAAVDLALGGKLTPDDLVWAAGQGEAAVAGAPHYDNVAASVLGGLAIILSRQPLKVVKMDPPELAILFLIPVKAPEGKKTRKAREILPKLVELDAMVEAMSAIAEFLVSLSRNDAAGLGRAVSRGGVVEKARGEIIPGYWELKEKALKLGALGCNISGAGPSILILVKKGGENEIEKALLETAARYGYRVAKAKPCPWGALSRRRILEA